MKADAKSGIDQKPEKQKKKTKSESHEIVVKVIY